MQSKKAWYEAVIQSEARPKRIGSSDAESIQSEPPPKERERASNEYSRMHSDEESLLQSRQTVTASGRERASTRER
jgi:hypothetical protein